MKIIKTIGFSLLAASSLLTTGCLSEDEPSYSDWATRNQEWIDAAEKETLPEGGLAYSKLTPDWAPGTFVLMKWYNTRQQTASKLSPLDNSTVKIKYELNNIDGTRLDDSYSRYSDGDSIYQTTPSSMISGVRFALSQMHVGDSVAVVVPYTAGYGTVAYGNIPPYSTLRFNIKLVSIPYFELPEK